MPDTPTVPLVTVFDANVYLGVSPSRLSEISEREASAGVLALASVWTCLEPLAKCMSEDQGEAGRRFAALQKIVRHAGNIDGHGPRLRLHEAGEYSLARGLFGHSPNDPMLELGFVGNLTVAVAAVRSVVEAIEEHRDALQRVSDRVRTEEEGFIGMTAMAAERTGQASFRDSQPTRRELAIVAAGLVQALAEKYDIPLTPANSSPAVELAFHAARGATLSGVPVLLVSGDLRLRRAAHDAGEPGRVATLSEYEGLVGRSATTRSAG
jgi:hypothetical protein